MIRHLTVLLLSALSLVFFADDCIAGYVNGYYRKDGTYVKPHYRKDKGSSASSPSSASKAATPSTPSTPSTAKSATKYTGKSWDVYRERKSRTFPKSMRQKKFDEQGGICAHCGKQCGSVSEMHGDHVIPWSKGGKTEYSNLQMLCPKCNLSKGNRYNY